MSERSNEIKARLYDLKVQADEMKFKYENELQPLSKEFNALTEELKALDKKESKEVK
jgi:hypothetical protein